MYAIAPLEASHPPVFTPAIDIHETASALVLTADLPGVEEDGLEITIHDRILHIHGACGADADNLGHAVYQEFRAGDFHRSFILGDEIDLVGIEADLTQGVLSIRLPMNQAPLATRPFVLDVALQPAIEASSG